MKKLFYALCVCSVLAFAGCSDDDDTPSVDLSLLNGKWHITEIRWTNSEGSGSDPMAGDSWTRTFNPDGTGLDESAYTSEDFTYSVDRYLKINYGEGDISAYTIDILTSETLGLGKGGKDETGEWSQLEIYERIN